MTVDVPLIDVLAEELLPRMLARLRAAGLAGIRDRDAEHFFANLARDTREVRAIARYFLSDLEAAGLGIRRL